MKPITPRQIIPPAVRQARLDSLDELLDSLGDWRSDLYRIDFTLAGEDPRIALCEESDLSAADLADLQQRLARLDRASKLGSWTRAVLEWIARYPALRSADLARHSGYEQEGLKLNIRKLKNLGLTESLEVGYQLSPRGSAVLARPIRSVGR